MISLSLSSLPIALHESKAQEELLKKLHEVNASSIVGGRNIRAGAARALALQVTKAYTFLEQDPIFQESFFLAQGRTMVIKRNLQNIFLMMKYGMKNLEGDIIEFGSHHGGVAIFMANVARRLGMASTIYALDTFEGLPTTDSKRDLHVSGTFNTVDEKALQIYLRAIGLNNIVVVKGCFEETVPNLLCKTKKIILAHIDCDIYSAVKYAITSVSPYMHPAGGYLVFDDPLCPMCLGALQAVEELLQWKGIRAEQSFPHLVYRIPTIEN